MEEEKFIEQVHKQIEKFKVRIIAQNELNSDQNDVESVKKIKRENNVIENIEWKDGIFHITLANKDILSSRIILTDYHTYSTDLFNDLRNNENIFVTDENIEEAVVSMGDGCKKGMEVNWFIEKENIQ